MKKTITKMTLVALVAAAVVGCAAPGPAQPQGPKVPVNTEANIQAFRQAEQERLRVKFEAEADAKAREEQALRERATLQYLEAKQKHLESQPRGLPPLPAPRRIVRKPAVQPCTATTACPPAAAPGAQQAPAAAPGAVVVAPGASPKDVAPAPMETPQDNTKFTPRRSAS